MASAIAEIGLGLGQFLVEVRRFDRGQQFPRGHAGADVLVPHLQVAADAGIDWRLEVSLDRAGKGHLLAGDASFRMDHVHHRDRFPDRQLCQVVFAPAAIDHPVNRHDDGRRQRTQSVDQQPPRPPVHRLIIGRNVPRLRPRGVVRIRILRIDASGGRQGLHECVWHRTSPVDQMLEGDR